MHLSEFTHDCNLNDIVEILLVIVEFLLVANNSGIKHPLYIEDTDVTYFNSFLTSVDTVLKFYTLIKERKKTEAKFNVKSNK